MNKIKQNFVPFLFATIVIGLFAFPFWSHFSQEKELSKQVDKIDSIVIQGGDDLIVGASTLFAQNASVQGNLAFFGEIKPDGLTCSNGEILKRTGANNWDCASDSGGVASNSLDWDEIVPNMTLDTALTIASAGFNFSWGGGTFVGIGTTTPLRLLNLYNNTSAVADNSQLRIQNAGAGDSYIEFLNASQDWSLGIDQSDSNAFLIKPYNDISDVTTSYFRLTTGGSASVSANFEIGGYASASQYFGAAFNLSGGTNGCAGANDTLNYNSTTGLFSCGSDTGGSISSNSLNFDEFQNPLIADTDITFTGGNYAFTFDHASVSQNFEVGTDKFKVNTSPTGLYDVFNVASASGDSYFNINYYGGASVSQDFEVSGYASASFYQGSAFGAIDCNDNAEGLQWSTATNTFTCRTWADADIPDTLSMTGTWATTGNLTIGDNGDDIIIDSDTWNVDSLGAITGLTGITTTGNFSGATASLSGNFQTSARIIGGSASHSFGGSIEPSSTGLGSLGTTAIKWSQMVANKIHAFVKMIIPSGTSNTFTDTGEIFFDTTANEFQIASASANTPLVIPTTQRLWAASIASTSNEFFNGGRIRLPTQDSKFKLTKIYCGLKGGTSVVINVSSIGGNFDSETVTCTPGGASDTSIGTNPDYSGFTRASASLEFGAITGTLDDIDWLDFSVWGTLKPQ